MYKTNSKKANLEYSYMNVIVNISIKSCVYFIGCIIYWLTIEYLNVLHVEHASIEVISISGRCTKWLKHQYEQMKQFGILQGVENVTSYDILRAITF